MTPEAQRIAIAEACPTIRKIPFTEPTAEITGFDYYLPDGCRFDPLNDLNAMHEAEKALQQIIGNNWVIEYERSLITIMKKYPDQPKQPFLWMATASQRAEAFLRTLNLWKDE